VNFLPLKHYYRSLIVALLVPLIVAFLLCLHIYNIKLERTVEKREADFLNVSAQINHGMQSINDLMASMLDLYAQPTFSKPSSKLLEGINQYDGYYYRHFTVQGTEIVGKGDFDLSPDSLLKWQQLVKLGSSFNTTLALMQSLTAVAYVDESGAAFVSRRNKSKSLLLTEILEGRFRPDFKNNLLSSSPIVNIDGKAYYSIGRQRELGSNDYIIVIYDVEVMSAWLKKITPSQGEYIFINRFDEVIVSTQSPIAQGLTLSEHWPEMSTTGEKLTVLTSSTNFFMQPKANLPIHAAFYEPKSNFVNTIRYEVLLEFVFLTLFLSLMFSVFFWLSQRIFLKPMTHLMHYLEQSDTDATVQSNYQIPINWQPWFTKIKHVFAKNEQLVESLQEVNRELDEKLKLQSEKLTRSYQAKERHLALLNTMLNSVPDFIYFKNIDGSFLGCNKAFEAYIGRGQSALVGRRIQDITTEHEQISVLEKQVLQNRSNVQQRVDNEDKSYQLTIAPFYNEHQHLLGTMGIGRDITEQQQTLHALKASESKFRSAIEFAANSVVLLSLDQTILQVNKAARKLFIEHNVLVGEQLKSLFDDSQWLEIKTTLAQLLDDKKEVYHLTLARGKLTSWLQLSVSLVWDEKREPSYYVIHLQDVSALTKAKHNAERATLAKSRFIANLSHEIRTPLNAVLGLLDMLIEQGLTNRQLQQTDQAKQAAESLLLMLNRMLDFARVESAQAELKLSPFSVVELVDICDSLTGPLCEQKGVEFIIDVDPLISPNLVCDSIRLQQVLGNLLTNAVKFTHKGSITLKMELIDGNNQEQEICFSVIDTGSGIGKDDQLRLFDAFTQGDESSTRIHQGVGLGLAIVKHAVSLMGGEIALNSEKGLGCEFYFSISLQVDDTKNQLLPVDALAIISQRSRALKRAVDAYSELTSIDLDEALNYPIKLSGCTQLIVDEADLPELLNVKAIHDSLTSQAVSVIIINHQLTFSSSMSEGLLAQHVKASALGQRLFDLSSSAALKHIASDVNLDAAKPNKEVSGLLVLAIDDNQLNLEIISSVLKKANINVVTSTNASDGMELLQILKPDLILMDVQMPHIDGCQATALIRQQFDDKQLPIFALTAHCEPADVARSLKCGMNKHLTKPVVAKVLLDAIADTQLPAKTMFFDRSFALAQFSADEALLNNMVDKFANLCEAQLQQIDECTAKGDLVRLVHSIKGVSGNLGFKRLSSCALQCEQNLKATNDPEDEILKELIMQLKQVIVFIRGLEAVDVK
jgi:two-component system sensor histidine kinase BarA